MTIVNITTAVVGSRVTPVTGSVKLTYWQGNRPAVTLDGSAVVFAQTAELVGAAVEVEPTGLDLSARWDVETAAGKITRFTTVPDSTEAVDFADLPDVDPALFKPVDLTPSLAEYIDRNLKVGPRGPQGEQGVQGIPGDITPAFIALADDVDADADRAGSSAFNAAASAASAQSSEDDARAAAAQAGVDATAAATARTGAQTARTGAETAQAAAEAARNLALAGQFAGSNLGTRDLNEVVTAGAYFQSDGTTGSTARNYPINAFIGTLQVYSTGNTTTQVAMNTRNAADAARGTWQRRRITSSGSWSAWYFAPTQRINSPAGQPGFELFTWDDVNGKEVTIMPGTSDLGSTVLDAVTLAGSYRQNNGGNATTANKYPRVGAAGVLEVMNWNGSGGVLQRYTPYPDYTPSTMPVFWERGLRGGTWSEWRAFASTRWDNTVGRRAFTWDETTGRDQMTYGDTGWRDIASTMINGWTGTLRIRRTNSHVAIRGTITRASDSASDHFMPLITGFRAWSPDDYGTASAVAVVTGTPNIRDVASNNVNLFLRGAPQGTSWRVFVDYDVTESWPTSLPGSAAGVIPVS